MKAATYLNPEKTMIILDKNHMNRCDLASQLGISPSYLSLMMGQRRAISPKIRRKLVLLVENLEKRKIAYEDLFLNLNHYKSDNSSAVNHLSKKPTGTEGR